MSHYETGDGSAIDFATDKPPLERGKTRSGDAETMCVHAINRLSLIFVVVGAVVMSVGHAGPAPERQAGKSDLRPAAPPDDVLRKPAAGRMFVSGRVVDAKGQPIANAAVIVYARPLEPEGAPYRVPTNQGVLGEARADASGRFRIDVPRISSSRHDMFGAIALVPGHGAGWVGLDLDSAEPVATITLRPEQLIHGRRV